MTKYIPQWQSKNYEYISCFPTGSSVWTNTGAGLYEVETTIGKIFTISFDSINHWEYISYDTVNDIVYRNPLISQIPAQIRNSK